MHRSKVVYNARKDIGVCSRDDGSARCPFLCVQCKFLHRARHLGGIAQGITGILYRFNAKVRSYIPI